jgi:hypothetical protein
MNSDQVKGIVKGRFFTATFIKKDGSTRKMNCRLGVKRHLKGGQNTKAHLPHYLTVYSVPDKGYRSINLDTLISIKANGKTFTA